MYSLFVLSPSVYLWQHRQLMGRLSSLYLSTVGYWKVDGQRYRSVYAAAGRALCKCSCSRIQWVAICPTVDTWGEEDSLGLGLGICDLADEDGVLRVVDVSLLVHVGGGNCKHGAVVIEGQRGDAGRVPVELTQALLVERVPDVHKAVWATWGKQGIKVNLKSSSCHHGSLRS